MADEKEEVISIEEYQERCKQQARTIPMVKAEAVVKIFNQDGSLKSTLNFSSEEVDDAT